MLFWFWFVVACAIQVAYIFTTGDLVGSLGVWFWYLVYFGLIKLESDFNDFAKLFGA